MLLLKSVVDLVGHRPRLFFCLVAIIVVFASVSVFSNDSTMSINWTFPYFSGAANFQTLFDWRISPSDFAVASRLSDADYIQYKHAATTDTISYSLNSYGYVLIALVSRTLFHWLGDIQAVIFLQIAVHLLICLLFGAFVLDGAKARLLFLLLYAANPLVIHFVTFPFYYFWLSLPSACIAALILKPAGASRTVAWATPVLLISLMIRPTTIFLCFLFYVLAYKSIAVRQRAIWAFASTVFVACLIIFSHFNPRLPPFHTMYIGFGAYPNQVGVARLSDNEGFRYFTSKSGVEISTNPINGNWGSPRLMNSYNQVVRSRYFQILSAHPFLAVRNSLESFGQLFSVGYIVGSPFLSMLSSVFGYTIVIFLLSRNQALWVGAVVASALSFFWYFPPIPAYNFAAYLLIVCGLLSALRLTGEA